MAKKYQKYYKFTLKDVADAVGKTERAVLADQTRGKVDLRSIDSFSVYIVVNRLTNEFAKTKPKTPKVLKGIGRKAREEEEILPFK